MISWVKAKAGVAVAELGTEVTQALLQSMRAFQARMPATPDPHTEWLTMLWGARFDRLHAIELFSQDRALDAATRQLIHGTADLFDPLDMGMQGHVRQCMGHALVRLRTAGVAS